MVPKPFYRKSKSAQSSGLRRISRRAPSCVTMVGPKPFRSASVSEHLSRKELKQDKIKETIEHGAEAVLSHGQFIGMVIAVALAAVIGYGGRALFIRRPNPQASRGVCLAPEDPQGGNVGGAPRAPPPQAPLPHRQNP